MNAPIRLLYPESEAAQMLDVCTRTMRKLRVKGEIQAVLVNGRIKYTIEDINRFIEGKRQCASTPVKAHRISGSAQPSGVFDFAEAQAKRRAGQPRKLLTK